MPESNNQIRAFRFYVRNGLESNTDAFIDNTNQWHLQKGDTLTLYFNSQGGNIAAANAFIDSINFCHKIGVTVTLIAAGDISSATFWVFFTSNATEKIITKASTATIHLATITQEYTYNGISDKDETFAIISATMDSLAAINKEKLNFFSRFLSAQELELIIQGGDVELSSKRLQQICDMSCSRRKKNTKRVEK